LGTIEDMAGGALPNWGKETAQGKRRKALSFPRRARIEERRKISSHNTKGMSLNSISREKEGGEEKGPHSILPGMSGKRNRKRAIGTFGGRDARGERSPILSIRKGKGEKR